jgi:4-amino-4-deoxy-L-arabinose transferase-like glycosyltransferase
MLIVNVLGLRVLAASTCKIAELSMNRQAGWLAALIAVTYPPILGLASIARPHAIVPAAVALTIASLLLAYRARSPRHACNIVLPCNASGSSTGSGAGTSASASLS